MRASSMTCASMKIGSILLGFCRYVDSECEHGMTNDHDAYEPMDAHVVPFEFK